MTGSAIWVYVDGQRFRGPILKKCVAVATGSDDEASKTEAMLETTAFNGAVASVRMANFRKRTWPAGAPESSNPALQWTRPSFAIATQPPKRNPDRV